MSSITTGTGDNSCWVYPERDSRERVVQWWQFTVNDDCAYLIELRNLGELEYYILLSGFRPDADKPVFCYDEVEHLLPDDITALHALTTAIVSQQQGEQA